MPYSTDWPERCGEKRITKAVETEQSDPHGRQGERIKDRSCPVCYSSYLLQSQGFVPRALGLWLNRKYLDFSGSTFPIPLASVRQESLPAACCRVLRTDLLSVARLPSAIAKHQPEPVRPQRPTRILA